MMFGPFCCPFKVYLEVIIKIKSITIIICNSSSGGGISVSEDSSFTLVLFIEEPNNDSPMNSAAAELWDNQEGK